MPKRTTTTAQKLGSVVKSARDIMRTDKGLNGELDRLPQLTWIMFLKLLDDSEKLHEAEAKLEGIEYKPTIKPPYRWRDWAANEDFTSDKLKSFINNDEAVLPDGNKGEGLLAYLRNLKSKAGNKRADVIAKVFKDVNNRMISGTLLWDVLNKVNEIRFDKYDYLTRRLFKDRLHKDDEYNICFARRGTSERTEAFKVALESARAKFAEQWGITSTATINITANIPPNCPSLQAVDYFLWALQRLYERGEDRYIEFLWSKFALVHDIDDTRFARYGVYYTRKNPLTATKIPGI